MKRAPFYLAATLALALVGCNSTASVTPSQSPSVIPSYQPNQSAQNGGFPTPSTSVNPEDGSGGGLASVIPSLIPSLTPSAAPSHTPAADPDVSPEGFDQPDGPGTRSVVRDPAHYSAHSDGAVEGILA